MWSKNIVGIFDPSQGIVECDQLSELRFEISSALFQSRCSQIQTLRWSIQQGVWAEWLKLEIPASSGQTALEFELSSSRTACKTENGIMVPARDGK
jgi:hypothetical protein